MAIKTAHDLFIEQLRDIYSGEKQAVRIYPKLSKAASSAKLKDALQRHLEQTKGQLERLVNIFGILDRRAGGNTCEGMKGLIEEGQDQAEEIASGPVRDAALIGAAQRMEHYEIAAYGTVIAFAKASGQSEIAGLLDETLEEEEAADLLLTEVAAGIHQQALGGGEEDEDEDDEVEADDADAGEPDGEDLTTSKGAKAAREGKSSPKESAKKAGKK